MLLLGTGSLRGAEGRKVLRHPLRKLVDFRFEPFPDLPIVARPRVASWSSVAVFLRGGGRAAVAAVKLGVEALTFELLAHVALLVGGPVDNGSPIRLFAEFA